MSKNKAVKAKPRSSPRKRGAPATTMTAAEAVIATLIGHGLDTSGVCFDP